MKHIDTAEEDPVTDVGIRALKQNASAVVAEAAAGETITITDRGRPVARLIPVADGRLAELVAAGLATPPRRRLSDLPAPGPGPVLSAALSDQRADER
jgi:prevent-host-death family protein